MALVQLTIEDRPSVRPKVHWEVQTKAAWADDWRVEPYLTPLSASRAVAPGMSRAEFRYDYGEQTREDEPTFAIDEPLTDMTDRYVRIRQLGSIDNPPPFWVGIIAGDIHDIQGNVPATSQYLDEPRGTQRLVAFGLEYLLDRLPVEGAWCYSAAKVPTTFYVNTTPTFNTHAAHGLGIVGNRSDTLDNSLYAFSDSGVRQWWTNRQVAEYLLYYCRQPSGHAAASPTFELQGQLDPLTLIVDVHEFAGLSVWQALNHLVDRTRGLELFVWTSGDGVVGVYVFSVLGEPLQIGNMNVPANPMIIQLAVDDEIDFEKVVVKVDTKTRFDRIMTEGEQVKAVFTTKWGATHAAEDWTDAEETTYRTLDGGEDATVNDRKRRSESLSNVYQRFRMQDNWDWKDRNGVIANLSVREADGTLLAVQANYCGHRTRTFERALPILVPTADNTSQYLPPLVFFEHPDHAGEYFRADQPGDPELPACQVRMLDDGLGFEIKPQGDLNHLIAKGSFDAGGQAVAVKDPVADYRTMLATVCVATDERLRVVYTCQNFAAIESPRTMVLRVQDAELWYILGDTVFDVSTAGLLTVQNGNALLRDDGDKVRAVAALAAAWYGQDRAQVELTIQGAEPLLPLGSYLRTVSNSYRRIPVGTVVTENAFDFTTNKTRVRTGYWPLDVKATALNIPGLSDSRALGRTIAKHERRLRGLEQHTATFPARWAAGAPTPVGTADDPLVMLPADVSLETAQTDTWDRTDQGENDGLAAKVVTRVVYNDTGDQVLYFFYRTYTHDDLGALLTISAETRVTVDTPATC